MSDKTMERAPIREAFLDLSRLAASVADRMEIEVVKAGRLVTDSLRAGRKILVCGNGGSAADAQHFVAELIGRMGFERRSLAAISLSADPSVVTALGNDYGYERVFSRQVEGLGNPGDVLVAISTSGRSPNVLRAVESARQRGLRIIALLGNGGPASLEDCDVRIHIPSGNTQRVQELHTPVLHAICGYVERELAAEADMGNERKEER